MQPDEDPQVVSLAEFVVSRREAAKRTATAAQLRDTALGHAIANVHERSQAEARRRAVALEAGLADGEPWWWATQTTIARGLGVSAIAISNAAKTLGIRAGEHERRERRVVTTRRYDRWARALLEEHVIRRAAHRSAAARAIGFRVAEHVHDRGVQTNVSDVDLRAATREYLATREYEDPDAHLEHVVENVRLALAQLGSRG